MESGQIFLGPNSPGEVAMMTRSLLYTAPLALVVLMASERPASPAAWNGSMARDIATVTPQETEAPLVLVRGGGGFRGGGGGGGFRGGGGGGGFNRGGGGGGFNRGG